MWEITCFSFWYRSATEQEERNVGVSYKEKQRDKRTYEPTVPYWHRETSYKTPLSLFFVDRPYQCHLGVFLSPHLLLQPEQILSHNAASGNTNLPAPLPSMSSLGHPGTTGSLSSFSSSYSNSHVKKVWRWMAILFDRRLVQNPKLTNDFFRRRKGGQEYDQGDFFFSPEGRGSRTDCINANGDGWR